MSSVVSPTLRAQVRELEQGLCAYCHSPEELTVAAFEIDHIVPVSAGGSSGLDNLCLACPTCNRLKGTRQEAIDPAAEVPVSFFDARRQSWSDHFGWNLERTEILGLTPVGRATIHALQMNRPQLVRLRQLWRRLGYQLA